MRTDDSAPGGEKVVHVAHFFPQKLQCTVLSEIILKQFLPASHPGKISRLTTCLSSSCWYSLQKVQYRYSTKQLNSIRKEGSPSKNSLNFIKILGFWLVNTPDPGMSGMSGTSNNFSISHKINLKLNEQNGSGALPLAQIYNSDGGVRYFLYNLFQSKTFLEERKE